MSHAVCNESLASLIERVRAQCTDMGGCWVWNGAMDRLQPIMWDEQSKRCRRVRQLLWQAANGASSPHGLSCRFNTHGCVCPRHIALQSHQEAIKKGIENSPEGRAMKRVKLQKIHARYTDEQLIHIRSGVLSKTEYSQLYGCHRSTISRIQNMRSYQPVSSPFAGLFTHLIPRS